MAKTAICIDFDGVLHINGAPVPGMARWCRQASALYRLICSSARFVKPDQIEYARDFLQAHDFPEMDLSWGKPLALWYIDDRAIAFQGPNTLPSPTTLLTRPVWYESNQSTKRTFKGTSQ